jgi:hypothetical protein
VVTPSLVTVIVSGVAVAPGAAWASCSFDGGDAGFKFWVPAMLGVSAILFSPPGKAPFKRTLPPSFVFQSPKVAEIIDKMQLKFSYYCKSLSFVTNATNPVTPPISP